MPRKRAPRGAGSVHKRKDGRWEATLWVPGPDGELKKLHFYGRTEQEALEKLEEAKLKRRQGELVATPQDMTLADLVEAWLEAMAHRVRPITLEMDSRALRARVLPHLGDVKVSKLQPLHFDRLYNLLLERGLRPTTVNQTHRVIHRCLAWAVRKGILAHNPAAKADPPTGRPREPVILTPEQAQKLIEAVRGHYYETLWVTALTTGARLGELLGLTWEHVNLDEGTIRIEQTLQWIPKGGQKEGTSRWYVSPPKSESGRRTIVLPPMTVAVLRRHRAEQAKVKLLLGEAYEDHGFVFATKLGRPLWPQHVRDAFKNVLKQAGLPEIRLHDLRHSHLTHLLLSGEPVKDVQERSGHARAVVLLDTYGHFLPGRQVALARRAEELYNPKRAQK